MVCKLCGGMCSPQYDTCYNCKLKNGEIKSASSMDYFKWKNVPFNRLDEIQIGTDGTKECILRFNNNDFVVTSGTIDIDEVY